MVVSEKEPLPNSTGINRNGERFYDPSANVIALVEAESKRHDELRLADKELHELEVRRIDDLRNAESRRLSEQATAQAVYQGRLDDKEKDRLDSIRLVDTQAVAIANERAGQQAIVLANQVAASAETQRTLVNTTATTIAAQLESKLGPLSERLGKVEQAQYELRGKAGVSDPALDRLTALVETLAADRSVNRGQGAGANAVIGYIIGAVGLIGGVIGIVIALTR